MTAVSLIDKPAATSRQRSWAGMSVFNALFVLPFVLIYMTLTVYPLFKGMWMSAFDYDLMSGESDFIGLGNFIRLSHDKIFLGTVWNTIAFVLMTTPAFLIIGLALALALNHRTRLHAALRTTFFATSVLSVTIVTLMWRVVLVPDKGLVANLLALVGLPPIPFITSQTLALPSVGVVTVWWCIGLPMMLFLAALQQIPEDIYEAAALDNASRWRCFTAITLPSIKQTVVLVAVVEIIMQFQLFGQSYLMTRGGPNNASRPIVQFIYETAFRDWRMGYGAAAAQVLFVIMLAAAAVQMWVGARQGRKGR
jgi:multiple sugar transport system permease protein